MLLGVNIDHIATLRNARGGHEPDPIIAADICEQNGATSITTHLREDRRHIKDKDVYTLIKTLKTCAGNKAAFNLSCSGKKAGNNNRRRA